jgi:DNA anti-recombination protein RmuC
MAAVLLILLLGVGLAAALVWLARTLRELRADWSTQLSDRNAEVDRHLIGVTETMDRRLSELDTKVDRRLENASQTTNKIHERLGKVDEATTQMLERAKDLARLEQALRPPKARGGFGELLLENLLRDRLPPSAYETQYTFDSGERVDAIVRADRTIPVDSKFPLDNYLRFVNADSELGELLLDGADSIALFDRELSGVVDGRDSLGERRGDREHGQLVDN